MVEKYKLNLIVASAVLLITIWLIQASRVWDFVGRLLLAGAIAFVTWTLLKKEKQEAKLLEFFIKSLIVSYTTTSIIWFVSLTVTSPWYYSYLNLELLMNILILNILPLALLPVAISIIVYGIFRIRLRAWEIFLSSWYVSMFIVFAIYQVWWDLYVRPYLPEFYYSSIAAGIAVVLNLVFLSLLIAGIITILYVVAKRQKTKESSSTPTNITKTGKNS